MHPVTGYYFLGGAGGKYVMYSTMYDHGRYLSIHNREGLTEAQAKGKFLVEHSHEVDRLMKENRDREKQQHSKIIQINN